MEDGAPQRKTGQVTLSHVLWIVILVMPPSAMVGVVKDTGGGALKYLVSAVIGLVLGSLILWMHWKIGRAVWPRFQRSSQTVRNVVAFGLFAQGVVWALVGLVVGVKSAALITRYF